MYGNTALYRVHTMASDASNTATLPPQRDHSFLEQNVAVEDTLFVNCQFSRCRIIGPISEASFSNCAFNSVIFSVACEDCTFDSCRLSDVRFASGCSDCTWTRCTLVAQRGTWLALRCVFVQCNLRRAEFRKKAAWSRCRLSDCTFDRCVMDKARFVDCNFHRTSWRQCSMARVVVSRCVYVACAMTDTNTTSGVFAGNAWRKCTWADCNGDYSSHVAEDYSDTTCVRRSTRQARWARCRFARDRHEHVNWYRTHWSYNTHVDSTWRTVKMHCSVVDGARYTNVDAARLDDHDTTYTNVRRDRQPYVGGALNYYDDAESQTATTTHLFAQHRRVLKTGASRFRLRPSVAVNVDFVYVRPVAGWFTFGFSQPLDAHHFVSYVTCGSTVFYPSKDLYLDIRTGVEMVGYRRTGRQRAGSL